MAGMVGADVDALIKGAGILESIGSQVGNMARPLRSQLYSSHWNGAGADRFRQDWDRVHGPSLRNAEDFLRAAGKLLRQQAEEQLQASRGGSSSSGGSTGGGYSGGGGGGGGGGGWGDESSALDEIERLLTLVGVPIDKLGSILEEMRRLSDIRPVQGVLKALLDHEAVGKFFSVAGNVIKVADLAIDFLSSIAAHSDLPIDEAIVFAGATVAVGLAVDAGAKAATKFVGGAIAGAITGGAAAPVGAVVGVAAGTVLSKAFDSLDEQFNISDNIAQDVLDEYRYAKSRDFNPAIIARDKAHDAITSVTEGAKNMVESGVDKVQDVADFISFWD